MQHVRIWTAMLFALIVAAACADGPTTPERMRAGDAGPSTDYMLDPITVIGTPQEPTCDPYTDPNWCEGDDGGDQCMTSTDPGTSDPELVYVSSGCTGPGTGGPGGGDPGGSTNPDDGETVNCDPVTDPECEKPLTSADSTAIANALASYLRPTAEIQDTTARRQCEEMRRQFNASYALGNVFRGGSDTDHYGAMYNDRIHFDPQYLDAAATGDAVAQREIANTALHEAAHVLGFDHPAGPTWQGTQDYYTDVPFNLLSPGPNSCIRY
jgi:hypothetical protein